MSLWVSIPIVSVNQVSTSCRISWTLSLIFLKIFTNILLCMDSIFPLISNSFRIVFFKTRSDKNYSFLQLLDFYLFPEVIQIIIISKVSVYHWLYTISTVLEFHFSQLTAFIYITDFYHKTSFTGFAAFYLFPVW